MSDNFPELIIERYGLNDVIKRFTERAPDTTAVLFDIFDRSVEFKDEQWKEHFRRQFAIQCIKKLIEHDQVLKVSLSQHPLQIQDVDMILLAAADRILHNGASSEQQ